jgi:hypothetical protein
MQMEPSNSPFPQPRVHRIPEWWHRPNILRGYCTPTVVRSIATLCGQHHTSANLHVVSAVRADPSLRPIACFLDRTPNTADGYAALLPIFFTEREVGRITRRPGDVEARIRSLRSTGRPSLTWWDLIREDLDAVLDRAQTEYFAGEDDMWFVPRMVRRARRVTCSNAYWNREVKEWNYGEGRWWLEAMFPKVSLATDRLISEYGF